MIRTIIRRKRDGEELTAEEILKVAEGAALGTIPDYQLAALLMAICLRGMSERETAWLTSAMASSGNRLDFSSLGMPVVDKHSTGGVGDKVSLILAPIVASLGIAVPMISGRGLGHTGGTVDKLESIPGLRTSLSLAEVQRQVSGIGIAMAAQSDELAPADRRLYALRDVTATVESLPLITASILSKKLAEGLGALVMDVKVGRGAFMRSVEDARDLADSLHAVARANGLACRPLLTRMDAPLGRRIGNWLEVCESIRFLRGEEEPPLLTEVVYALCGACIQAAGHADSIEAGEAMAMRAVEDGTAWEKFLEMVEMQGGDLRAVESAHEPQPSEIILSDRSGCVNDIDSYHLGMTSIDLGAGRRVLDDQIAPEAGIVLYRHVGEHVERGEPLCGVVERRAGIKINPDDLRAAFSIGEELPSKQEMVIERRW